jgi:hypothetical protein
MLPDDFTKPPAAVLPSSITSSAANGWNNWIFNSIGWDSQAKDLITLKHKQELFVTKWAHNIGTPEGLINNFHVPHTYS